MLTKIYTDLTQAEALRSFNYDVVRDIRHLTVAALKLAFDLADNEDTYMIVPFNCKVLKFWVVISVANATGDGILILKNSSGNALGTVTVVNPSSVGDTFEDNSMNALYSSLEDGATLYLDNDGGCNNAGHAELTVLVERGI